MSSPAKPEFTRQPEVVDGASDLLVTLFGEAGRHARTATGAAQLAFGAAVEIGSGAAAAVVSDRILWR